MDAVEFLKERKRMCDAEYKKENGVYACDKCPAYSRERLCVVLVGLTNCFKQDEETFKHAVAIVEKWSNENPVKTFIDDFMEKHPNAPMIGNGNVPKVCPHEVGYEQERDGMCKGITCYQCWTKPFNELK